MRQIVAPLPLDSTTSCRSSAGETHTPEQSCFGLVDEAAFAAVVKEAAVVEEVEASFDEVVEPSVDGVVSLDWDVVGDSAFTSKKSAARELAS